MRYLAYVDGRLVDSWTEDVHESPYRTVADRFDRERRPIPPPPPLPDPEPEHVAVLHWLDSLVGGREVLLALDAGPTQERDRPPGDLPAYEEAQAHLERVVADLWGHEAYLACLNTLALLAERDPEIFHAWPGQQIAAGIAWVVGKANVLFRQGVAMTTIQRELWSRQSLHVHGQRVAHVVRGAWLASGRRPRNAPDYHPFGTTAVLTLPTRRSVCQWRDIALAQDALLPSEVES